MKRNWNEKEDKYTIKNANILTWQEMASFLDCSLETVQRRAEELGIEVIHKEKDRWTKEEIELLKEYSNKYVAKTIAKKLNKSYRAVCKKALNEGIKLKFKNDIWKKWMINYLYDNIENKSINEIASFLEISSYQVKKKCKELNLTYETNRWTKEEEDILINNALKCHYSELTKLIPNKSKSAILAKAKSMNIKVITETIIYTEEEANYVINNWYNLSISEISRNLKIPRSKVLKYKEEYNLPDIDKRLKWDETKLNKLKELANNNSIEDLAKKFHTTKGAVKTIAYKNNIKLLNNNKTPKETIDKIKELAPNHTINEISKILNISANAISSCALRNKIEIKKDKTIFWKKEEIDLLIKLCNNNVPIYEIMKYIYKLDTGIINKCKELNLDYIGFVSKPWCNEEINSLLDDAKSLCINELVIKYQRSSISIRKKLKDNNVTVIGMFNYWKDEETNLLHQLVMENKTVNEIANILNRSVISIEGKIKSENLSYGNVNYWSKEEEIYLEDNWDEHTILYLSKKLNRTEGAIKNKAFKMGLKKQFFHPDGLTISEISEIFNVRRIEIEGTWMILGLPYKEQKISNVKSYKYVNIDDLFNFLEQNQFLFDGKDLEENILGIEPTWLKEKRRHDYMYGFDNKRTSLIKKKLLQQKKYYLEELKDNKSLRRMNS